MPSSSPGKLLTGLRGVIGGGAWVAPRRAGKVFGLDLDANPQAEYVGRLFGVRDAVLGVGLATTDGDARRLWWQVGIACDVLDSVAGVLAVRSGSVSRGTGAVLVGTALFAAGLGTAALVADDV